MKFLVAAIVTTLTMSAAWAGGMSFRFDPNPPKPPPRHVEPHLVVRPPLTAFDRNMVPPANASTSSDDYDLSERITFGAPQPKKRH